jgi:hypothetical protein
MKAEIKWMEGALRQGNPLLLNLLGTELGEPLPSHALGQPGSGPHR